MIVEQRELMCRNHAVLSFAVDADSGDAIGSGHLLDESRLPLEFYDHGRLSLHARKISDWWRARAIPDTRDHIHGGLQSIGVKSTTDVLNRSLGLSLSDQYWVRPQHSDTQWEEVNFYNNDFDEDLGKALFSAVSSSARIASDKVDFNSPDATSAGDLPKRWSIDPSDGSRVLIKSSRYNQEPLNERIASDLCARLGISHVEYQLAEVDNRLVCMCKEMLTDDEELISAWQAVSARSQDNQLSKKNQWIVSATALGAEVEAVTLLTDGFILVDFLMRNIDRHYGNFGLIRNVETLSVRPAPLYDMGASLWVGELHIDNRDYVAKPFFSLVRKPNALRHLRLLSKASWERLDLGALKDWPQCVAHELSRFDLIAPKRVMAIRKLLSERIELVASEREKALR
ncbi:MAG: HipA domain-containing protein [Bifidobacterium aquikefiri]|uniref:Protein kinase n=1 Tax=Bifidobacterium aquikefiri TaxID=1653207 RepID=A0A261GAI2_9BIFI|nr:HipA domain-containing protein [Bifidobacterium aquikefiri]OZG68441.1 protein kinase [Bifidobacterium aquikefiri]